MWFSRGGGTAGHLYPALAVADVLRRRWPRMPLVFFGSGRAIDAVVLEPQGAELIRQPVRPVAREPWRWPGFLRAWRASTRMCRTRFAQVRPDIVVGSGGYAGGPAIAVAARMGIPTMLLNPDLVPGKANRWLANRVDRICVQFAESRRHFHAEAPLAVTGCPVRPVFGQATRADGIARFGLDPARKNAAGHRGVPGGAHDQYRIVRVGGERRRPGRLANPASGRPGRRGGGDGCLCPREGAGSGAGLHPAHG
jgi:UDP-N-acetylglucosamine:LPS N-acetylglucosamine transferase